MNDNFKNPEIKENHGKPNESFKYVVGIFLGLIVVMLVIGYMDYVAVNFRILEQTNVTTKIK